MRRRYLGKSPIRQASEDDRILASILRNRSSRLNGSGSAVELVLVSIKGKDEALQYGGPASVNGDGVANWRKESILDNCIGSRPLMQPHLIDRDKMCEGKSEQKTTPC